MSCDRAGGRPPFVAATNKFLLSLHPLTCTADGLSNPAARNPAATAGAKPAASKSCWLPKNESRGGAAAACTCRLNVCSCRADAGARQRSDGDACRWPPVGGAAAARLAGGGGRAPCGRHHRARACAMRRMRGGREAERRKRVRSKAVSVCRRKKNKQKTRSVFCGAPPRFSPHFQPAPRRPLRVHAHTNHGACAAGAHTGVLERAARFFFFFWT